MKKFTILLVIICCILSSNAQNSPFIMSEKDMRIEHFKPNPEKQMGKKQFNPLPEVPTAVNQVDIVEIIDIGTSANAYTYWENLTYLWVDPELNTVTNIHRMGGALDPGGYSGDLGYDISTDGGMTWTNMIEIFQSYLIETWWINGRFPQAGIYNPEGNTNPDEAYVAYFAPVSDTTDQLWSYTHGVGNVGDTAYHTQSIIQYNEQFYLNTPNGFDINSNGEVFIVDENTDQTGDTPEYKDSLIISRGTWDTDAEDFIYAIENLEAKVSEELGFPIDYKIAFGPDGQTGYIVMLGDNDEAEKVEGFNNIYPIYWKTTDGGDNWTGPEEVQLDGPNGVATILESHLTDNQLEELFGSSPPARDEISYTTSYDCEIAVDKDNRLHIAVVIGPTGIDPYSIITASDFIKAYDIFMYNENEPFCGAIMGSLRTFRGYFGDFLSCDNRIQMTTNPEHDKFFISWLDTDLEGEDENARPNIWCRGFDPYTSYWKTVSPSGEDAPTNVTNFSDGMWEAYFATAPKYTFAYDGGYTIPYVFMDMDPMDESQPVQFKYVQNFKIDENDWPFEWEDYYPCGWVGQEEFTTPEQPILVLGNYPNPFRDETTIRLELYRAENISLTITSITGQRMVEKQFGKLEQGYHELQFKLDDLPSGIYFYTLSAGNERVTKKMVVE